MKAILHNFAPWDRPFVGQPIHAAAAFQAARSSPKTPAVDFAHSQKSSTSISLLITHLQFFCRKSVRPRMLQMKSGKEERYTPIPIPTAGQQALPLRWC
jgi:hypothetical protein